MTEKSKEHCLMYTGDAKCHYTGKICDDDFVQICKDYRSDEGTYLCPYCGRTGLKALNYGSEENPEIVWECSRCGGELWNCESKEEMLQRCEEMKKRKEKMTEKRFTVEKMELISDHLSTRFFIKDNEEEECYDVQHIVSVEFEVQYESWADKIAEKMNELNDENQRLKRDNETLKVYLEQANSTDKECDYE